MYQRLPNLDPKNPSINYENNKGNVFLSSETNFLYQHQRKRFCRKLNKVIVDLY